MLNNSVKIPKWLHEIHGEETSFLSLVITYLTGLMLASMFLFLSGISLPVWKSVVVFILLLDVGGGVISNFSIATNRYYQKNRTKRLVFPALHLLQPALMILVFPGEYIYLISVGIYTVICSYIVLFMKKTDTQQIMAAMFLIIGIFTSYFLVMEYKVLHIFGILFMIKLIPGFSLNR